MHYLTLNVNGVNTVFAAFTGTTAFDMTVTAVSLCGTATVVAGAFSTITASVLGSPVT